VKAIITDSEASKNDIARLTHFPHDKIFVIYLAPGEQFKPQGAKEQEKVKGKYKLTDSFVLYVGDVNWNKNIPTLIRAMKGVDVSLVLVGNAFLHHDLPEVQLIQKTIEETNQREKIIMLGYIPDSDLPAVYSLASLYVQPSIAEGFGLPVLEAMACGTPAVVSLKTSLAEIAGPSILVDPEDSKNIKSSIQEMLKRDRKSESQKARDWAARFTWEKTAVETVKVYKGIL
ncbi:MAG: glycosyltransferase family 1 protein, partial [Bacteroidetes bacterium]